jgi:hypothetical protein
MDFVLSLFSARRPWRCKRCGWTGRTSWKDDEITRLPEPSDDRSDTDPALQDLDRHRVGKKETDPDGREMTRTEALDSLDIDLADPPPTVDLGEEGVSVRRSRRMRESRRGEIVAAVTLSALAVVLVTFISLTSSCQQIGGLNQ